MLKMNLRVHDNTVVTKVFYLYTQTGKVRHKKKRREPQSTWTARRISLFTGAIQGCT